MITKSQIMKLDPHANAALLALLEKKRREKETGITALVEVVEDGPNIREPLAEIPQEQSAPENCNIQPEVMPLPMVEPGPTTAATPIAPAITEDEADEPVYLSQSQRTALEAQWRSMNLVDLLPAGQRAKAAKIIQADPNKGQILELCKLGVYDAFEAMSLLGMEDPYLCDLNVQIGSLSENHGAPKSWAGELPAFCIGAPCTRFDGGFCFDKGSSAYRKLGIIEGCPRDFQSAVAT